MTEEDREARKEEMRARLSAQIKFWQLRYNMDVPKLAKKTGMAENSIYRIKRGEAGTTVDTIALLADAFRIPPCMLLMPLENVSDD